MAIRNNLGRTILDNGAAEGQPTDMEELVRLGRSWGVHEIVLPDILGKAQATISASRTALKYLISTSVVYQFRWMAVAQGSSLLEAYDCALQLASHPYVNRIAVPRILTYHFGKNARIDLCTMLAEAGIENIHCLGASPWIREVEELTQLPNVSSMDTSMPVYLGYMGYAIDQLEHDAYKLRPKGYFGFGYPNGTQAGLITHNCRTFYKWANPEASDGHLRELFPELSGGELHPEPWT